MLYLRQPKSLSLDPLSLEDNVVGTDSCICYMGAILCVLSTPPPRLSPDGAKLNVA
jgi:hypothetical protein